jgi:oligoribonuclease NrnB/cAMP/cGMP phosphodiesterase (DHH superfamily)
MAKTLCIYHNDDDGFGAAWVIKRFYGADEFVPAQYGQEPPDVRGKNVIIVDFSYKRPVMERLIEQANTVTVLDHHKTAKEELAGLSGGPHETEIIFDMSKSGVLLAWEYCNVDGMHDPMPMLIDYLDAGDLWQLHRQDDLKEVQAALRSYPYDFEQWDHWMTTAGLAQLRAEGVAIRRYAQMQIDRLVGNALETAIGGHNCLAVNTSLHISEVAGALAMTKPPFGCCYFDTADGHRVFSLRSRGDFDVSEIAKENGGGGHKNAAGFRIPFPEVNR